MFDRKLYKKQAREQLKNHWTQPLMANFVTMGLYLCMLISGFLIMFPVALIFIWIESLIWPSTHSMAIMGPTIPQASTASALAPFIAILFPLGSIFIGSHFYLSFIKDKKTMVATFFEGFSLWLKGVLGYLWMCLWIFLWSLLLFVPGIIKSITYSQMFFIIVENPTMSVRKAMKMSMLMTKGHTSELFVMGLSFFGWYILAMSSWYIGFLWLTPYYSTSFTYAYQYMKQDAINRKVLTVADFGQEKSVVAIDETTTE